MASACVLFVDDHEPVRRSLRDLVTTTFPDLVCLEAASGEEAVELAARHRPEVALMDIMLPGISGIQATRKIRGVSPGTRVVVVSILDTAAHRADATAAGAAGYVPKSDLVEDLVPILRRLLSATETAPEGSSEATGEAAS